MGTQVPVINPHPQEYVIKKNTYCTVPENNFTKFNAAANNAVNLSLIASFV
jgi:hypothetical protein